MSAATILERLHRDGLRVRTDGARVLLSPPQKVTPELLELVRTNKPAILEKLVAEAGERELPALSPGQEAARLEVLARLKAYPTVTRAFTSRWEADLFIVTLALRGVGTCELAIPADRMRRGNFESYSAILDCIEGGEGRHVC